MAEQPPAPLVANIARSGTTCVSLTTHQVFPVNKQAGFLPWFATKKPPSYGGFFVPVVGVWNPVNSRCWGCTSVPVVAALNMAQLYGCFSAGGGANPRMERTRRRVFRSERGFTGLWLDVAGADFFS